MRKFICDSEKYEIGGPNMDTIGLPVSITGIPPKINIEGYELSLKSSFHISLVCIGKMIEKQDIAIPDFVNKIVKDFCDFVEHNDIDLLKYNNEFRFVSQNERRTVIVMCEVSNLDKFFDQINEKYGLKTEYQTTHVTLYTLQPDLGIFLADKDDMQKLTKIIPNPAGVIL